jgi:D-alanine--poly(phosphoribitol) ligase subunit 1
MGIQPLSRESNSDPAVIDDVALLVMAELLGNQCQRFRSPPVIICSHTAASLGAALDALLVAMMTFWRIGPMNHNLAHGFYESALQFPGNLALSVSGREFNYSQLRESVQPVASWLRRNAVEAAPRVGILASRSLATYTGILGTCWAGGTYVPISTKLPESRLIQLLERVQAEALIVDSENVAALSKRVLSYCPRLILAPDLATSSVMLADNGKSVTLAGKDVLPAFDVHDPPVPIKPDHVVYIIYTSGTTGVPKGVMIPAIGTSHFIASMQGRYALRPSDRIAGMTEITFDLSVFDMFVVWSRGASLLIVPASQLMAPARFVQRQGCTGIFTVPSVVSGMHRMKMLPPGSLPSLRFSLLAGEPLPVFTASIWKQAAPNSVVDDLFGPTEATCVCIGQRFAGPENATPNRDVVAIGTPLMGMEAAIVDSSLEFVPDGQQGELLVAGPQLSSGYFGAEDLTRASFPVLRGKRWYRTGDLAYRDSPGTFHHLGRIDNQVKVRGQRVELEEVESYLREIFDTDAVAAVAWPVDHGSADGIVAFVSGQTGEDGQDVKLKIKSRLPSYMVPSTIHRVESLPLNAHGKVNRKELVTLLDEGKF